MSLDASPGPANLFAGQGFTPSLRRAGRPLPIGALLSRMGVGDPPPSFAPWPVWRDSTTQEVKFQPMPRRKAVRVWHDARRFERQTRQPGLQDGAIGRNGLAVLHALLFDFLNYATGRLLPSRQAIARHANISLRSVDRGLTRLRASGVVNWLRRCIEEWVGGRFSLRQETNAYAVLPPSQWRGYSAPAEAPPPVPGTWGDHPALPDAMSLALAAARDGAGLKAQIAALQGDARDALAVALGRLAGALDRRSP